MIDKLALPAVLFATLLVIFKDEVPSVLCYFFVGIALGLSVAYLIQDNANEKRNRGMASHPSAPNN